MTAEIVILNWNGRDHLRTFLPSVVAAAPAGVGVTVADNGSTDDSAEVLAREFPTVRVVRLGRNYGFAEGYNRALREVDAECFVLLNSDVETPAGWLEPLLEVLEREPDVAAVAPKLRSWRDRASFEYAGAAGGYLDLLGYPFCRGRILRCVERDEGQYDDERDVFWVSGAAFCCRAEVFRELGGFDAHAQTWITSQPYQVGVLLSSSNASTWTAHQDKDLAFRLLEAEFTPGVQALELGAAEVAGATDLLLLALAETPSAATRVEYALSLPHIKPKFRPGLTFFRRPSQFSHCQLRRQSKALGILLMYIKNTLCFRHIGTRLPT